MRTRAEKNLRFALKVSWLLFRGFLLFFLILVLGALFIPVLLPQILDGESVRGALISGLEASLHRPVLIDGVVLTPKGIKLKRLRVLESAGGRSIVDSDYALLKPKLIPLLSHRLELEQIKLVSPRLSIWRESGGGWNVAGVFSSTAAVVPPLGRVLPFSLAAEKTEIENGSLQIEDRESGRSLRVEHLRLLVLKFSIVEPFRFSAGFSSESRLEGRRIRAELSIEGESSLAALDWSQAYLSAKHLLLSVEGRRIEGSGKLGDFNNPRLEMEISLPSLGPSDFKAISGKVIDYSLPSGRLKAIVNFSGSEGIHLDPVSFRSSALAAEASGFLVLAGKDPKADLELTLRDFPLEQAAAIRPSLKRFSLKGSVSGRAVISASRGGLIVHKGALSARGFGATSAHATIEKTDFNFFASQDFDKISLDVSRGELSAFEEKFGQIQLSLGLVHRELGLRRLALNWGPAKLNLSGSVDDISSPRRVSVSGSLDQMRWESAERLVARAVEVLRSRATAPAPASGAEPEPRARWVHSFKYAIPKSFPDIRGRIRVGSVTHQNFNFKDAELLLDVRNVTPSLKNAGGEIQVRFGPGRVSDIEALQKSSKFLRIIFLPYLYMNKMNSLSVLSAAEAYPKTLDFNTIEGHYTMDHGLVTIHFTHVDSPQLAAFAAGRADFSREKIDLEVLTRLTNYSAPLPEWWVDELGRPAIGFRVTGDLNAPELEPRLNKIAADEIEKRIAEARGRAAESFKGMDNGGPEKRETK
jgi:hypothetical protein